MPADIDSGDVVVRVWKALYGLPRGDTDWGATMVGGMHELGMEQIEDSGEESSFVARTWPEEFRPKDAPKGFERPVLVAVYSDNFVVAGLLREAVAVHQALLK